MFYCVISGERRVWIGRMEGLDRIFITSLHPQHEWNAEVQMQFLTNNSSITQTYRSLSACLEDASISLPASTCSQAWQGGEWELRHRPYISVTFWRNKLAHKQKIRFFCSQYIYIYIVSSINISHNMAYKINKLIFSAVNCDSLLCITPDKTNVFS